MNPNLQEAHQFLQVLTAGTITTFQTFDDTPAKNPKLNSIVHGSLDANASQLTSLNLSGAGVFVMVNEGDGNGRKAENVTGVRAVFADFDGQPLPQSWELPPHIITESSPGRYHAYWLLKDCPLTSFTPTQKAIAAKYNSDPSVNDLPRVMRLPGFIHHKGEPFVSRVVSIVDGAPYSIEEILSGMGLDLTPASKSGKGGEVVGVGDYYRGSSQGGRTLMIVKLSRSLSNRGFTEDEAVAACLALDQTQNKPPLEETDPGKVERTVRDVYRRYVFADIPQEIAEMNETHFVAREGGKTVVCREEFDPARKRDLLIRSSFNDFRNFFANRQLAVGTDKSGNQICEQLGAAWLKHPNRRQYDGIVMVPNGGVPGYYNLWKGFAVKPARGCWKLMKRHIFLVICDGDESLFNYVMGWVARMVQQPGVPGEVALVMQGGRGTGKGIFANALCRLFGQHSCYVSNGKHVAGNFNAHLEDCILLFADEAFWAGDKAAENVLKGLITEPIVPIERKFADLRQVPNMLHVIMASNNNWVVPAGMDERRYCVLKVSNAQAGNREYFNALVRELDNGGLAAMLHDLLKLDLSGFEVRDIPKSAGLFEQKVQTLEPVQAWWYQRLQDGEISPEHSWEFIPTKVVFDDYVQTTAKMGSSVRRDNESGLGIKLRQLLPEGWPKKTRPASKPVFGKQRPLYYSFPPLEVCRKHFEGLMGMGVRWDEAPPDEWSPPCHEESDL